MKIECIRLQSLTKALLIGAGLSEANATVATEVLIATSLDGIDTHGISRLPIYLSCLLNGRINADPQLEATYTGSSTAVVNGDNGLGQIVAFRSMEIAIELSRKAGIGSVAVAASNHYGASSYFCEMAAKQNMVGIAFTNTPAGIPPWGGKRPYFGTNPIAFAFPAQGYPIVVDMSASVVARGNIIKAAKEGKSIPEGWAIDDQGTPTTDAKKALAGAVLPMAGAKGYALALAVEILAGVMSGAAIGTQVGWIYDDKTEPTNTGHFFVAIDIERFLPYSMYLDRIQGMIEEILAVPLMEGIEKIRIPGERRKRIAQQSLDNGIEVSSELVEELNGYAVRLGVIPLQ